mmetsp:Transcript_37630/g.70097  ORF Transcript_37630/g.70097 Transcript_37630/m.70097 type:complete len:116 (+) Transcript_37630:106-453(+)
MTVEANSDIRPSFSAALRHVRPLTLKNRPLQHYRAVIVLGCAASTVFSFISFWCNAAMIRHHLTQTTTEQSCLSCCLSDMYVIMRPITKVTEGTESFGWVYRSTSLADQCVSDEH